MNYITDKNNYRSLTSKSHSQTSMTEYYFNSLKKRLTLTNLPPAGSRPDRFKLRSITIVCLLSVICMSAHVF